MKHAINYKPIDNGNSTYCSHYCYLNNGFYNDNNRMNQQVLIKQIYKSFKDVKLEDGVGLWEGQGLDDYCTVEECRKLRERDEKDDWSRISVLDLYKCSSSLSFFDAKGMRFHLPQFLLFDLDVFEKEEDELHKRGKLETSFCPDVYFHLTHQLEEDYSMKRFSALNNEQVQCVISYLNYQIQEKEEYYKEFGVKSQKERDEYYKEIEDAIAIWKTKIKGKYNEIFNLGNTKR